MKHLVQKITMLVSCLIHHNRNDQEQVIKAMYQLRDVHGPLSEQYQHCVSFLSNHLESLQSAQVIEDFIAGNHLLQLVDRFSMLEFLQDGLKEHMIQLDLVELRRCVVDQNTNMIERVKKEIHREINDENFLEFDELRHFCKVYSSLKLKFAEIEEPKREFVDEAGQKIRALITHFRSALTNFEKTSGRRVYLGVDGDDRQYL